MSFQPLAIKPIDQGNVYEFAQSYQAVNTWSNTTCKVGGMVFRWLFDTANAAAGLVMFRDSTRTTQPTNLLATQIGYVLDATIFSAIQDNQNLWAVASSTVVGSIISGSYRRMIVDIDLRDATAGSGRFPTRFRISVQDDGSNGLSMLAEYWGPSYI